LVVVVVAPIKPVAVGRAVLVVVGEHSVVVVPVRAQRVKETLGVVRLLQHKIAQLLVVAGVAQARQGPLLPTKLGAMAEQDYKAQLQELV